MMDFYCSDSVISSTAKLLSHYKQIDIIEI